MRTGRVVALVVVALLGIALLPNSAGAIAPDHFRVTGPAAPASEMPWCPGFTVSLEGELNRTFVVEKDETGRHVYARGTFNIEGTLTNDSTGKQVSLKEQGHYEFVLGLEFVEDAIMSGTLSVTPYPHETVIYNGHVLPNPGIYGITGRAERVGDVWTLKGRNLINYCDLMAAS